MGAVALGWIVPVVGVKTEEEGDVAHRVSQGAEHVAEEEVAELDRVDTCEGEAELGVVSTK